MKRFLTLGAIATLSYGFANAQFTPVYGISEKSGIIRDYNRVGLSYNNDAYNLDNGAKEDFEWESNPSLNGLGINYVHGFKLSSVLPMFVEVGANVNFNFGSFKLFDESYGGTIYSFKAKMQNINLQVPVNYVYRFNVSEDFSIAPYLGVNLKMNVIGKIKEMVEATIGGQTEKEEAEWQNLYSSDDMEGEAWNRFQIGWQVGVGFQYSKIYLGVQYGTDFIPAYSYSESYEGDTYKGKINTSSLKINLGYSF